MTAPLHAQQVEEASGTQDSNVTLTESDDLPLDDSQVEQLVDRFSRLKKSERAMVLDRLHEACWSIDHPLIEALKPISEVVDSLGQSRVERHRPGRDFDAAWIDELPFPVIDVYRFGFGTFERADGRARPSSRQCKEEHCARVEALLRGQVPEADRVYAGLLHELDQHRAADEAIAFLARWRNGEESFFEALDRTAGTDEGVFHFDAMLSEWVRKIVPSDHPDARELRRGSDFAHQGFHRAFRNLRSYRQVREVFALAVLCCDDEALPEHLSAYESNGTTDGHCSRECFEILFAGHGSDIRSAIDGFLAGDPGFPESYWRDEYPGYQTLDTAYRAAMGQALEGVGDTHEAIDRWQADRRSVRAEIARTAVAILGEHIVL